MYTLKNPQGTGFHSGEAGCRGLSSCGFEGALGLVGARLADAFRDPRDVNGAFGQREEGKRGDAEVFDCLRGVRPPCSWPTIVKR